jgi:hypothetical protein
MAEQSAWSDSSNSDEEKARREARQSANGPSSSKSILQFVENDPDNPLNWSTVLIEHQSNIDQADRLCRLRKFWY